MNCRSNKRSLTVAAQVFQFARQISIWPGAEIELVGMAQPGALAQGGYLQVQAAVRFHPDGLPAFSGLADLECPDSVRWCHRADPGRILRAGRRNSVDGDGQPRQAQPEPTTWHLWRSSDHVRFTNPAFTPSRPRCSPLFWRQGISDHNSEKCPSQRSAKLWQIDSGI